jgi:DNA-binding response OmpR family regulator
MRKQKILIVDDDKRYVEMLELTLNRQGYNVLKAYNGDEALIALNQHPDLVILDIIMPGMDGWQVANRLASTTGDSIPYIFLTAKGQPHHRLTGMGLGAVDYITKPFHPEYLLDVVDTILKSQKAPKNHAFPTEEA